MWEWQSLETLSNSISGIWLALKLHNSTSLCSVACIYPGNISWSFSVSLRLSFSELQYSSFWLWHSTPDFIIMSVLICWGSMQTLHVSSIVIVQQESDGCHLWAPQYWAEVGPHQALFRVVSTPTVAWSSGENGAGVHCGYNLLEKEGWGNILEQVRGPVRQLSLWKRYGSFAHICACPKQPNNHKRKYCIHGKAYTPLKIKKVDLINGVAFCTLEKHMLSWWWVLK